MAQYNVLFEPWIPVRMVTGEEKEVGIWELLEHAHQMVSISDSSPLLEYGMYRLLAVFLMDALTPERQDDISDMLDEGAFDMSRIRDYVNRCEQEGPCFDLFDEKRPFLQSPYDERWDKNKVSVAYLLHNLPSGNNDTHFTHITEADSALCPAMCVKALCAVNVFAYSAGRGYKPSINGVPPYYVIVKGKNLFETLVFCCIADRIPKENRGKPQAVWMNRFENIPHKIITEAGLLFGMSFPSRRITLLPTLTNGICSYSGVQSEYLIHQIYYQSGLENANTAWRDPHVSYVVNKNGRFPLVPELSKMMWTEIYKFFGQDCFEIPNIVDQYLKISEKNDSGFVPITIYGLVTDKKSKFYTWLRDEAALDMRIAKSRDRMRNIRLCIEKTEQVATELKKRLRIAFKPSNDAKRPIGDNVIEQAIGEFFSHCRQHFFVELFPELAKASIDEPEVANGILQDWYNMLYGLACRMFEDCADRLGTTGRFLMKRADAQSSFIKQINKMLKGGDKG